MNNEELEPTDGNPIRIKIDVSEIMRHASWAFILSGISLIISLISIYRTIDNG